MKIIWLLQGDGPFFGKWQVVVDMFWLVVDIFWLVVGGGAWLWIYFGWQWMVVDGGGWWWTYFGWQQVVVDDVGWSWKYFGWWWVVVGGDGLWWVVVGGSIVQSNSKKLQKHKNLAISILRNLLQVHFLDSYLQLAFISYLYRISRPLMFSNTSALKNLQKFMGKHLCQSVFSCNPGTHVFLRVLQNF